MCNIGTGGLYMYGIELRENFRMVHGRLDMFRDVELRENL